MGPLHPPSADSPPLHSPLPGPPRALPRPVPPPPGRAAPPRSLPSPVPGTAMAAPVPDVAPVRDAASASSAGPWSLRHLHLDLRVSFAAAGAGRLQGRARLELRCERDGAGAELRLDAHPALAVSRAALLPPPGGPGDAAGQELPVESRPFASYGSALHIALPQAPRAGQLLTLLIDYEAGEGPGVSDGTPGNTGPQGEWEDTGGHRHRGEQAG